LRTAAVGLTGIVVEVTDLARDGSSSPDGDYAR
jgi:hypothetical protein